MNKQTKIHIIKILRDLAEMLENFESNEGDKYLEHDYIKDCDHNGYDDINVTVNVRNCVMLSSESGQYDDDRHRQYIATLNNLARSGM